MIGLRSEEVDLVALRAKLQAMSEAELLVFGKETRRMVYPRVYGFDRKPTVSSFSVQLEEARAEYLGGFKFSPSIDASRTTMASGRTYSPSFSTT
jgi:hypothetical protein